MRKLKSEKELKSASIIIRVTEQKKDDMLKKAKQAGLSLTNYIEQLSDKNVIVSLVQAQRLVKEIHQLNIQLAECKKSGIYINEIQDIISSKIAQLQQDGRNEGI